MCRGFTLLRNGVGIGAIVHYVQDKHDVTENWGNRKLQHAKLKKSFSVCRTQYT